MGDQSGAIHIWDLKTDHNEQLIPEPEVSVNSVHIDPDASYMAAVNSSVSSDGLKRGIGFTVLRQLLGCASRGQRQMVCTYQLCPGFAVPRLDVDRLGCFWVGDHQPRPHIPLSRRREIATCGT